MENRASRNIRIRIKGSILSLLLSTVVLLTLLGLGMLTIAYGSRLQAIQVKNDTTALLAAEAGYEEAIIWMGNQPDMFTVIREQGGQISGQEGNLQLENIGYKWNILFYTFYGTRPIYRIISNGHCGRACRTIDTLVTQAVGGWEMGSCQAPISPWLTKPVYFVNEDRISIPLHINRQGSPDDRLPDIYISGKPQFLQAVTMGESRYDRRNYDKYANILPLFAEGIYFDQPNTKITEYNNVVVKTTRFKENTVYSFRPQKHPNVADAVPALQMEFYVNDAGQGMVKITNNCTVKVHPPGEMDYQLGTISPYVPYPIYAYHYIDKSNRGLQVKIKDTYVIEKLGKEKAEPGGQIYVDGNVIIGGDFPNKLKGRLTVVATGNIWIVNSVEVDDSGTTRGIDGVPAADNPNVLGLVSRDGVIKVIDAGLSAKNGGPEDQTALRLQYQPVGLPREKAENLYTRVLPLPMVVEAALTVGGGGWGVENVTQRSGRLTDLIVRGSICEAIRGLVGIGQKGFRKKFYLDERLREGILPGDIWMQSKYVPIPGGWTDYRPKSYN